MPATYCRTAITFGKMDYWIISNISIFELIPIDNIKRECYIIPFL